MASNPKAPVVPVSPVASVPVVAIGTSWVLQTTIIGGSTGDRAGDAITMNGDGTIVAVASPFDDDGNGRDAGTVQVFQTAGAEGAAWQQIGSSLSGLAVNDRFGFSLAMSTDGTVLAIGSPFHTPEGTNESDNGLVRVVRFDGTDWVQIGSDIVGTDEEGLGTAISLSNDGTMLAIGSPGVDGSPDADGNIPRNTGKVQVYQNQNNEWVPVGNAIEGGQSDQAGIGVALNGDGTVVVMSSAEHNPDGRSADTGYIAVYRCVNGGSSWEPVGEKILGESNGDRFGTSVAISEDGSVVSGGALENDGDVNNSGVGSVRVFRNVAGVWTQIGQDLDGEDRADDSGEWMDMSADGNVVAIGAIGNNAESNASFGHVRVYRNDGADVWTQVGPDIDGIDRLEDFGRSVKLSRDGSVMMAGAPRADNAGSSSGEVRVFQLI